MGRIKRIAYCSLFLVALLILGCCKSRTYVYLPNDDFKKIRNKNSKAERIKVLKYRRFYTYLIPDQTCETLQTDSLTCAIEKIFDHSQQVKCKSFTTKHRITEENDSIVVFQYICPRFMNADEEYIFYKNECYIEYSRVYSGKF